MNLSNVRSLLSPKMVQDAAKQAFKLSYEDKNSKQVQRKRHGCCHFLACRHSGVGRTFKEVSALTAVPKNEIGNTFKIMERLLREMPAKNGATATGPGGAAQAISSALGTPAGLANSAGPLAQTTAQDLIARFCSYLGLSIQVTRAAEYIARKMKEFDTLAGRSPTSIASAVIYFASGLFGEPQSASKIAEKAGVAEGTIKTRINCFGQVEKS